MKGIKKFEINHSAIDFGTITKKAKLRLIKDKNET